MNRLLPHARPFAEPAAGALFFGLWVAAGAGRMGLVALGDHHLMWLVSLGVVSVGIALVRVAPVVSLVLPAAVLIAQVFYSSARFTENSWTAYLGFAFIGVGVISYAPARLRPAVYWVLGAYAVAVPLILTLPWFGPLIGRASPYGAPEALRNFSTVLSIVVFVASITWLAGTVLHRWETRPVAAEPAVGLDALSERENEVFLLAARGLSNAEIAAEAFISEATVKSHISHILAKLKVSSRARLVAYAWEHELVAR